MGTQLSMFCGGAADDDFFGFLRFSRKFVLELIDDGPVDPGGQMFLDGANLVQAGEPLDFSHDRPDQVQIHRVVVTTPPAVSTVPDQPSTDNAYLMR